MSLRTLLAVIVASMLVAQAAVSLEILVPAYFYPSFDPEQSSWDEMEAALAQGAAVTAIMNVDNGPGTTPNGDYLAAVQSFRAAGGRVVGYVYTCYGVDDCQPGLPSTRSAGDVLADVDRYAQWYPVDGIFLDEVSNETAALPFYQEVADSLRSDHPEWQLIGNPGTAAPAAYLSAFDTIVTFEQGSASYDGAVTEPWMASEPASRQAHLHYNATDAPTMYALLAEAVERNAGYVYITDDRYTPGNPAEPNPWDQLPSYWLEEVAAAVAVPEPAGSGLLALGIAALVVYRRRRIRTRVAREATRAVS